MSIVPEDDDPGGRRGADAGRAGGRRRVHRRGARHRPQAGRAAATARRLGVDCGTAGTPGRPRQHLRQGHALRRRPVLLHPRPGRLPELRGHAGGVRRALARGLGRDPHRPARQRVADELTDTANTFKLGVFPFTNDPSNSNGNGVNGPCWERDADNHQGFSTGPLAATVDDAPNAPGVQVVVDARRGSAPTRRRPTTPTARPAATTSRSRSRWRDLPAAVDPRRHIGPEHHAVRRGQHGRRGHDDAAPHRPEHAPGVVDVRQRPVRPVPLGPRDARRATRRRPAARRRRRRRTCRTRTSTASTRRRRSTSRRATACRSPAASRRRRATASRVGERRRSRRARPSSSSTRDRAGHRARVPVGRRQGLHPGLHDELRAGHRPAAGLRPHAPARSTDGGDPAVVAGHERSRRPRPGRAAPAAAGRR